MPLDLVAEVVANNGSLPNLSELLSKKKWLTRKNGLKFTAVWFVSVVLLLLPLAGITGAPEEVMGSLAVIGIFGSLLLILLSFLFLPKAIQLNVAVPVQQNDSGQPQFIGGRQQQALPPQQSIPASAYSAPAPGSWRDTNDLQPTSVTEGTTRMFKEREDR